MKRTRMIELRGNRSQEEMSKLLGITKQFYMYLERGDRGVRPKTFKKYERVFGESIYNLMPDMFEEEVPEDGEK